MTRQIEESRCLSGRHKGADRERLGKLCGQKSATRTQSCSWPMLLSGTTTDCDVDRSCNVTKFA